ncbi:MAG TPA: hypothetical protein VK277_11615 [Acidimicrobiales bacterium]|nr:hypothetical protein [Acidimicrobiales bacterium]
MFGRRRKGPSPPEELPVEYHLEQDIATVQASISTYLEDPTEDRRRMLLADLERLDDQTARADTYTSFKAAWTRFAVPGSSVIGATSDQAMAEEVPDPVFQAQVALVKAAKKAVTDGTPEALDALRTASAALTEAAAPDGDRPSAPG